MNNKKIIGVLLSASMIAAVSAPAFAKAVTDKTQYKFGDSITITRENSEDAELVITNSENKIVLNDAMVGGNKEFKFKIPAADSELTKLGWKEGKYTVKVGSEETSFELAKSEYTFVKWDRDSVRLGIGGSATVTATFSEKPGDSEIVYESKDANIASISSEGIVRGVAEGRTSVVATLKDKKSGKALASSTALEVVVVADNSGNGGNGGSGSTGTGSGGTLAGGNMSGGASGTGIAAKPDAFSVNFQDLGDAAWAAEAINFLAKKGVVTGYDETTFNPNGSVTRAEFAKLISSLYNLVNSSSKFATQSFTDVPKDAWYFNYVEVCAQLGIVNGYGDKTFAPNNLISRQEMAVIISRVAKVMGTKLTAVKDAKTFADANLIADYAAAAIDELQRAGIISGTSDTTFEPTAGCTRAQAATIIYNLYVNYAK